MYELDYKDGHKAFLEANSIAKNMFAQVNGEVNLKDMKNLYPVHTADYAVQRCISGNPAFAWWIRHVMAKRNCIIGKLK